MKEKNSILATIVIVLAVIGAVNWGLIGFFNFNLVDAIFGGGSAEETSTFSRVIYALVGLAGLATLYYLPRLTRAEARGPSTLRTADATA